MSSTPSTPAASHDITESYNLRKSKSRNKELENESDERIMYDAQYIDEMDCNTLRRYLKELGCNGNFKKSELIARLSHLVRSGEAAKIRVHMKLRNTPSRQKSGSNVSFSKYGLDKRLDKKNSVSSSSKSRSVDWSVQTRRSSRLTPSKSLKNRIGTGESVNDSESDDEIISEVLETAPEFQYRYNDEPDTYSSPNEMKNHSVYSDISGIQNNMETTSPKINIVQADYNDINFDDANKQIEIVYNKNNKIDNNLGIPSKMTNSNYENHDETEFSYNSSSNLVESKIENNYNYQEFEDDDDNEFQDALSPPPVDSKAIGIEESEDETNTSNYMDIDTTSAGKLPQLPLPSNGHINNTLLMPQTEDKTTEMLSAHYYNSVASPSLSITSNLTQSDCATFQESKETNDKFQQTTTTTTTINRSVDILSERIQRVLRGEDNTPLTEFEFNQLSILLKRDTTTNTNNPNPGITAEIIIDHDPSTEVEEAQAGKSYIITERNNMQNDILMTSHIFNDDTNKAETMINTVANDNKDNNNNHNKRTSIISNTFDNVNENSQVSDITIKSNRKENITFIPTAFTAVNTSSHSTVTKEKTLFGSPILVTAWNVLTAPFRVTSPITTTNPSPALPSPPITTTVDITAAADVHLINSQNQTFYSNLPNIYGSEHSIKRTVVESASINPLKSKYDEYQSQDINTGSVSSVSFIPSFPIIDEKSLSPVPTSVQTPHLENSNKDIILSDHTSVASNSYPIDHNDTAQEILPKNSDDVCVESMYDPNDFLTFDDTLKPRRLGAFGSLSGLKDRNPNGVYSSYVDETEEGRSRNELYASTTNGLWRSTFLTTSSITPALTSRSNKPISSLFANDKEQQNQLQHQKDNSRFLPSTTNASTPTVSNPPAVLPLLQLPLLPINSYQGTKRNLQQVEWTDDSNNISHEENGNKRRMFEKSSHTQNISNDTDTSATTTTDIYPRGNQDLPLPSANAFYYSQLLPSSNNHNSTSQLGLTYIPSFRETASRFPELNKSVSDTSSTSLTTLSASLNKRFSVSASATVASRRQRRRTEAGKPVSTAASAVVARKILETLSEITTPLNEQRQRPLALPWKEQQGKSEIPLVEYAISGDKREQFKTPLQRSSQENGYHTTISNTPGILKYPKSGDRVRERETLIDLESIDSGSRMTKRIRPADTTDNVGDKATLKDTSNGYKKDINANVEDDEEDISHYGISSKKNKLQFSFPTSSPSTEQVTTTQLNDNLTPTPFSANGKKGKLSSTSSDDEFIFHIPVTVSGAQEVHEELQHELKSSEAKPSLRFIFSPPRSASLSQKERKSKNSLTITAMATEISNSKSSSVTVTSGLKTPSCLGTAAPAVVVPSIWTQQLNKVKCQVCLVQNEKSAIKCISCESPIGTPGTIGSAPQPPTSSAISNTLLSATTPTFTTFGSAPTLTQGSIGSGGFSFNNSLPPTNNTSITFGATTTSSPPVLAAPSKSLPPLHPTSTSLTSSSFLPSSSMEQAQFGSASNGISGFRFNNSSVLDSTATTNLSPSPIFPTATNVSLTKCSTEFTLDTKPVPTFPDNSFRNTGFPITTPSSTSTVSSSVETTASTTTATTTPLFGYLKSEMALPPVITGDSSRKRGKDDTEKETNNTITNSSNTASLSPFGIPVLLPITQPVSAEKESTATSSLLSVPWNQSSSTATQLAGINPPASTSTALTSSEIKFSFGSTSSSSSSTSSQSSFVFGTSNKIPSTSNNGLVLPVFGGSSSEFSSTSTTAAADTSLGQRPLSFGPQTIDKNTTTSSAIFSTVTDVKSSALGFGLPQATTNLATSILPSLSSDKTMGTGSLPTFGSLSSTANAFGGSSIPTFKFGAVPPLPIASTTGTIIDKPVTGGFSFAASPSITTSAPPVFGKVVDPVSAGVLSGLSNPFAASNDKLFGSLVPSTTTSATTTTTTFGGFNPLLGSSFGSSTGSTAIGSLTPAKPSAGSLDFMTSSTNSYHNHPSGAVSPGSMMDTGYMSGDASNMSASNPPITASPSPFFGNSSAPAAQSGTNSGIFSGGNASTFSFLSGGSASGAGNVFGGTSSNTNVFSFAASKNGSGTSQSISGPFGQSTTQSASTTTPLFGGTVGIGGVSSTFGAITQPSSQNFGFGSGGSMGMGIGGPPGNIFGTSNFGAGASAGAPSLSMSQPSGGLVASGGGGDGVAFNLGKSDSKQGARRKLKATRRT